MKSTVDNVARDDVYPPMPFILSAPRSGSTLLLLMLDAHSDMAIPPETGYLAHLSRLDGSGDMLRKDFYEIIVNFGTPSTSWDDFGIAKDAFWKVLCDVAPFTISKGLRAFYSLYADRFAKKRCGDKTPSYCKCIPQIRKLFPEARFIHLIRDGRDVALSLREMWFSPGRSMTTQATYWSACVESARSTGLGRDDYLEVHYEDLILCPRKTLGLICAHIDLELEDSMLRFYERSRSRLLEQKGRNYPDGRTFLSQSDRLSQQHRTFGPLDEDRVFAWRAHMTSKERSEFEEVAGPLLQDLGYE